MARFGSELECARAAHSREVKKRKSVRYLLQQLFPLLAISTLASLGELPEARKYTGEWMQHRFELLRSACQFTAAFIRETSLLALVAILYGVDLYARGSFETFGMFVVLYFLGVVVCFCMSVLYEAACCMRLRIVLDKKEVSIESGETRIRLLRDDIVTVSISQDFFGRMFRLYDVAIIPRFAATHERVVIRGLDARSAIQLQHELLSHDFGRRKRC